VSSVAAASARAGCRFSLIDNAAANPWPGFLAYPIAFGLTLLRWFLCLGHISGLPHQSRRELRPLAGGKVSRLRAAPYNRRQVLGAVIAGGVITQLVAVGAPVLN